jgi:hypothetical protein
MESTYELIKQGEDSGYLQKLMNKGVLPYTPIAEKEIYEMLLDNIEQCKKKGQGITQAVLNTAIQRKMSESAVWKIKKKMEG